MQNMIYRFFKPTIHQSKLADLTLVIPRVIGGLLLAFFFGASKFGLPWTPEASNLSLFQVSDWFIEDVDRFGGVFSVAPGFFAWMGAGSEAIGGLLLMLGLFTRGSSFLIICTMSVAIFYQKWDDGIWAMLPALGFMWIGIYHFILGSGRFGLDQVIARRIEKNKMLSTPIHLIANKQVKTALSIALLWLISCNPLEAGNITFRLKASENQTMSQVSIRGSVAPLSWEKDLYLKDEDEDGIFEIIVPFTSDKKNVKFKFYVNGKEELQGADPRVLWFKEEAITKLYTLNEYDFYSQEQISELTFTEQQIAEDLEILERTLTYIHPAVYEFIDSSALADELRKTKQKILLDPSISNTYGAISEYLARIKCSHTFTNPWNQGERVDRALFYQPDKIPFTFQRIGKRIFIDKNASENEELTKGLEIISINGVSTAEILNQLSKYVSSDGSNYEKKLDRLLVTGEEKYSLFDIFYPLEFGSPDKFILELKELREGSVVIREVQSISKTQRTAILEERYGKINTSIKDGWNFEIINQEIGHLKINSFAIQRNEFDWKDFIDRAFDQVKEQNIENLIVDIRGNEGGQGIVGEYILKNVIKEPIRVPAMESTVSYLTIPEVIEKYINTWDRFPYDFTKKVQQQQGDKYLLKGKFSVKEQTYKPKRDGFTGEVYLMTDASNSSATHLMSMYAKQIENITIVGQETGGNQMGTNGGFIFFLRLPNTKIVVDIPVIHMYVPFGNEGIDGGVKPDISIEKKPVDLTAGVDTELQYIIKLINNQK